MSGVRSEGRVAAAWKALAAELKRKWVGMELHHAFGRRGRELACRLFVVPLYPEIHRGKNCGGLTRDLRDELRRHFLAYETANRQNRDVNECWYAICPERERCGLRPSPVEAMELRDDDGGEE